MVNPAWNSTNSTVQQGAHTLPLPLMQLDVGRDSVCGGRLSSRLLEWNTGGSKNRCMGTTRCLYLV